jgi:hypothetical protein
MPLLPIHDGGKTFVALQEFVNLLEYSTDQANAAACSIDYREWTANMSVMCACCGLACMASVSARPLLLLSQL